MSVTNATSNICICAEYLEYLGYTTSDRAHLKVDGCLARVSCKQFQRASNQDAAETKEMLQDLFGDCGKTLLSREGL